MNIAARLLALLLPRWAEERAFKKGFCGDAHRKFEELGPKTVRHLLESRGLANELEHNAAGAWLARQERAEAWRNWGPFVLGAIAAAGAIANLVVNISK